MTIVSAKDISDGEWDAFCDASSEAWVRHRTVGRRSALSLDAHNIDCSFGVISNGKLVAVVPLVAQTLAGGQREFAYSSSMHTPAPALADDVPPQERAALVQLCMDEVDRRAAETGAERSRMFVDPAVAPSAHNPLTVFGYEDASTVAHIIDLQHDEEELRAAMAKGHRLDITFAEKEKYIVDFFDHDSIIEEKWRVFVALYDAAAGKSVYSPAQWAEILQRLRGGFGLLGLIRRQEGEYLSAVFVTTYKQRGYYSMGATAPEHRALRGAGHLLQWRTMLELKRRGFKHYDIGWQSGDSPKDISIADFKRRFGGTPAVLWAGIKTYPKSR